MFGLAMGIFSFFTLLVLDEIHAAVVPLLEKENKTNPVLCFLVAIIVGVFSEIGLRMVAK